MGRSGDLEAIVVASERKTETGSTRMLVCFYQSTSRMLGFPRYEIARVHFPHLR